MLASFALVFTEWQLLSPPTFVGVENVRTLLADRFVGIALFNTAYFTFLYVPLNLAVALGLALLVLRPPRGIAAIRTLFSLPSVTPTVAYTALWIWLLNADYGLINLLLRQVAVQGPRWLGDPAWAKPALILMSLWGFGSVALIFLAALQGVPEALYEAAALDGAGRLAKFWNVTLPMISPAILFNLVIGMINSFQIFTSAYVIEQDGTPGRPANSTLFLVHCRTHAGL